MTSAIFATFSDVVGFLAQSFKLAAVFPSFIFVLLNEVFILPHLPQRGFVIQIVTLDLSGKLLIAAVFSLLLGYTLTIINIPLIRLFEGYPWRSTWPGNWLIHHQEMRKQMLEDYIPNMERDIARLEEEADDYRPDEFWRMLIYRRRKALEKRLEADKVLYPPQIDNYFPIETPILPTALGNTIAAFEDYPSVRYGIDAVTLWPRLLPILTKENYAPYVEREKAGLDFTLNMCFLLLLSGLEMIFIGLIFSNDCLAWLLGSGITVLFAFLFYQAAITGAFNWGTTVRVAFDLYRYHLLRALYGRPPGNFAHELTRWEDISRFIREGTSFEEGGLGEEVVSRALYYSRIKKELGEQEPPLDGKGER